jgi:hypothetical protein
METNNEMEDRNFSIPPQWDPRWPRAKNEIRHGINKYDDETQLKRLKKLIKEFNELREKFGDD